MIKTFGELLEKLVGAEKTKLAEFSLVKHPGLIGDMYEGLARHLAERALTPTADLRVVKGKITSSKGEMSRQIDCMIVQGEGRQLPYTDHWIYDVQNVLAVIEVKKSLYGADLRDAISLMADLRDRIYEPHEMPDTLLRDAWTSITGLPFSEDLSALSPQQLHIHHTLVLEANLPLRIVLGFEGFVSERGLREALVEVVSSQDGDTKGPSLRLSPGSLPSLVLCRNATLIKLNGMPYPGPFSARSGAWGFLGSRSTKPMHALLELLWTRLSYYFNVPPTIFGEDMDADGINLLLRGRIEENGGRLGWNFEILTASDSELAETVDKSWQPFVLTKAAFTILNALCNDREVDLSDSSLLQFLDSEHVTTEDLIKELNDARLAAPSGGRLELLTKACACGVDPELGFVAAENKTGRMDRWLAKRLAEGRRKGQG